MATDVMEGHRRRGSAVRVTLTVVLCLTVLGAIGVRNALKSKATPPSPLPSPNGYDDLLRAAALIEPDLPTPLPTEIRRDDYPMFRARKSESPDFRNPMELRRVVDPSVLRARVNENAEALRAAREGLAKPSRVPVVYKSDLGKEAEHATACRAVGRLFASEAEVAVVDGRPGDAARSYLDLLRLAGATGRGGLAIDAMTGWSIEAMAVDGLGPLRDELPADELRTVIAALRETDRTRGNYDDVRNVERFWGERVVDFKVRLMMSLTNADAKLRAPAEAAAIEALERTQLASRRLALNFATRLYILVNEDEPDDPTALVPDYIDAIPLHPITSRPITEVQ